MLTGLFSYFLLFTLFVAEEKPQNAVEYSRETKIAVAAIARDVVNVLKEKDIEGLVSLTHPEKGIRFSPYGFVGEVDRVIMKNDLRKMWQSKSKVFWGLLDATGRPIRRTFKEYYKRFIYDRDFATTKRVTINDIQRTNRYTNVFQMYPGSIVVEFYYSGNRDFEELDWRALRLVFEQYEEVWYLSGIIHDEWTQSSSD